MKNLITIFLISFCGFAHAQLGTLLLLVTFEDNMGNFYEDYVQIESEVKFVKPI